MSPTPVEFAFELRPRARFDAIDVHREVTEAHGDPLRGFARCLYCSFHTTAGYLDQSLATRLSHRRQGIRGYVDAFRALFPEGAGYRHDEMDERTELHPEQRQVEPCNADSHLAFIAAGLRSCASYVNRPGAPVFFVDLDGVNAGQPRRRQTSVVGYTHETMVWQTRLAIPVSSHPVDSINLKDPNFGLDELVSQAIASQGVTKGRLRLALAPGEHRSGLTVNEYETLLMRHDLVDVLRDPLRFVAEKGRHAWQDPRAIPVKALGYAAYDLVQAVNRLVDALGLHESLIERLLARAMAVPAERFLRMKRSVSLLVSDRQTPGTGSVVQGTYQSPILIQWGQAPHRIRHIDVTLSQLV